MYGFQDALADGVLRDVTDVAAKAGIPYPTFVSAAFWNSREVDQKEYRVLLGLEAIAGQITGCVKRGQFGLTADGLIDPDLDSRGWPAAACPCFIRLKIVTGPSDRFGALVVVTLPEEELDFRVPRSVSGSFFTM